MEKTLALIVLFTINLYTFGQVVAPCDDDYGSSSDEDNIMLQMRFGTLTDALQAIEQAKNTRGISLGCPQVAMTYSIPIFMQPL